MRGVHARSWSPLVFSLRSLDHLLIGDQELGHGAHGPPLAVNYQLLMAVSLQPCLALLIRWAPRRRVFTSHFLEEAHKLRAQRSFSLRPCRLIPTIPR